MQEQDWCRTRTSRNIGSQQIIQKRKEEASEIQARKEKEDATRKRIRAAQIEEAEAKRLAQEQKDREDKRLRVELERVRKEELKKQIADLKSALKLLTLTRKTSIILMPIVFVL